MKRVYALYALSGLVSLAYQVSWFRIYVDWFGSTNLTFALVLCNFIGGLGTGALFSKRTADTVGRIFGIRDPLRLYGAVELIVALSVSLLFFARLIPPNAWGDFPYVLTEGIYEPGLAPQAAKLALAALCVFVPCFFMGVTFPLLCQAFGERGNFPSALYAWNTLGACSGVLLCEFVFLPRFGHDPTLWAMAATNALLGVFFLATGGGSAWRAAAGGAADGAPTQREPRVPRDESDTASVLVACAVLSGLVAGGLEADMFKRVGFLANKSPAAMSFISFWAILAIFTGSSLVRWLRGLRLVHVKLAFGLALGVYFATWQLAYPLRDWLTTRAYAPVVARLPENDLGPVTVTGRFPTSLGQVLLFAGLFVFPTYLLISLLLPYVCNRLQASRRHLGVAYGANTLAFCFGMVAFTWLAPAVSVFYSMKLAMVGFAVLTLLLASFSERGPLAAWKPVTALLGLVAACVLVPADFDPSYVTPGQPNAIYPVRAMRSNGANTTYVVAAPDGDRLYFDNHSMSGTNRAAQVYMRLMAHFPLLAHPDPRQALLICFGVGNTADAISCHAGLEGLDVVDLNDKVIETAPEFERYNHGVYADPRIRFIHDDGRSYLNATSKRYDLITSEPPPPLYAGVYRLYSREYYERALERLTDTGLMSQWLPVHEMPQEAVDLAVATFVEVFPHTLIFVGTELEFILIGSAAPIELDRIAQRFDDDERVVSDLARIGVRDPLQLLARVAGTDAQLEEHFGGGRTISDQNNDLTYVFARPLAPGEIAIDPLVTADALAPDPGPLRELFTHLGKLRYLAEYPFESLATVPAARADTVALAGIDWMAIQALLKRCRRLEQAAAEGDPSADARRVELLSRGLEAGAEQPELLFQLARAQATRGNFTAALETLESLLQLVPDDPAAYETRAKVLLASGETVRAIEVLEQTLELDPARSSCHTLLAMALDMSGEPERALASKREAVELEPYDVEARMALGLTLAQAGELDEALEHWSFALRIHPSDANLHYNVGLARLGRGELEAAIARLEEAVRLAPDFALAHRSLGNAWLGQGDAARAVEHLERATELDPADAEARAQLGRARALSGS